MCLSFFVSIHAQRIAVIDFNAGVGISQADVDGISAIFNTYFSPAGYTLVERGRIDRVIDEQQFQRGKLTEQQMVKIGQILNISQIVVGDVNIVMNQYNVDVRVLNVQSGTIAAKDGATWTPGSSYRTMMKQLATRLAGKIAIRREVTVQSSHIQTSNPPATDIRVLYGYLKVFPNELGTFETIPKTIILQINKQAQYGYNTWRIPNQEELSLLQAHNIIPSTSSYMSIDGNSSGRVILVTDTKSVAKEVESSVSNDVVTLRTTTKDNESTIHNVVDDMPEFPGGQSAMFQYFANNVIYPVTAKANDIQGRVICQFVVNRDGSIVDVVVVRSSGNRSLDEEAIRVIKAMPRWSPGRHRGKAVRVQYTVPINFSLQ